MHKIVRLYLVGQLQSQGTYQDMGQYLHRTIRPRFVS